MTALVSQQTVSRAVPVQQIASPRGVNAWLVEDYAVPLVSLEFAFRGGAAQDPPGKAGAATMLAGLLDEGAGDLDSQAFQRALDEKAIEISFNCDRDHLGGRMRTLVRNVDRAGELLRLAINAPRLDEEPIGRVREQISAGLRRDANDPASLAGRIWRARTFPHHPYGAPARGTLESLATIERADLTELAKRLVTRGALHIAVVGAVDAKRAAALLDEIFADLPRESSFTPVADIAPAGVGGIEIVDLDVPQSTIRFGRASFKRHDPDYMAAVVITHILGGGTGLSSRLFREVREKRGLAYSVDASLSTLDHAAFLHGGTSTKNERARESLDVIKAEIIDLANSGPTPDELEKGKKYLVGSYALRFDTSAKIAGQLVHIQMDGFGPEWLVERNLQIEAVTMDDAKRVAHRLFGDGGLSVAVVGKPAGL
ncbi:MAG TPA: pitrilysin family protein [Roseiarcus sp.]|nr:pitrilysin family protein [Roseiarcus sp.]